VNAPHAGTRAEAPASLAVPRGRAGLSFAAALLAALAALAANKLRAALTALGIFIGVAAVIATVAVGAGARQQVLQQIQSLGANLLIIWASNLRLGGVSLGAGQRPTMQWDDAQAVAREVAGVEVAAGTIRQQHQLVFGNQNWAAFITATDPEWFVAHDWGLEDGRFFTTEENMSGRKVVLLGQTVAQNLFGEENPVGQEVRIRATPFEVIGVLARKGQNPQGQDQDDQAVIPYWTARRSIMGGGQAFARHIQTVSVKVHEGEDMAAVEEEIRRLFRQRHRVPATDPDTVVIRNMTDIAATRDASARTLSLLLMAVACVSLLVGGIGVMNIMLVSVTERTREIGLRLAVGARRSDILKQFLLEAVLLALLGGAAGVAGGFALAHGLAAAAGWPVLIQWDAVALAVGVAGLTGLFFGYWPARRAARLDPIAALRTE
jgi:putative ABC transport system permease protein